MANFQVKLGGEWKDYPEDEDKIIKRAFSEGKENCKITREGATYKIDFRSTPMVQRNLSSGKEREVRPPFRMQLLAATKAAAGTVAVAVVTEISMTLAEKVASTTATTIVDDSADDDAVDAAGVPVAVEDDADDRFLQECDGAAGGLIECLADLDF
mmetsp:Transcript_64462/g.153866  ORF Transcript_64462/g.153866 Transcript_64462/m.153866 type:complete len:156 (+) Transcript_64462:158-625(+)|eukprot:CAMPEP_0178409604 /NCGR_PEP_ID=MMETSP0689_2-20121128/20548_1 /TAXON_ID=160604 /ORGANISM="Amphidinium massartii, Strain CS-259" /LENGTH=155 /DNA_ID=CAMNT_0020030751 /DNA_START=148 /DNA_END=615 /DNA_ORIENTATION=+